jgi:hypothetical protein
VHPKTVYADAAGAKIAYQLAGRGPDPVTVPGMVTHLELLWRMPALAAVHPLPRFLLPPCSLRQARDRIVGPGGRAANAGGTSCIFQETPASRSSQGRPSPFFRGQWLEVDLTNERARIAAGRLDPAGSGTTSAPARQALRFQPALVPRTVTV